MNCIPLDWSQVWEKAISHSASEREEEETNLRSVLCQHTLKVTGIDWRDRRLISNLYMAQGVKSTTEPRGDEQCEDWKKS
jgi:hypothetical protein